MFKGSDAIGLPVVTFDTGEKIEKVSDVVFDHEGSRVLGFLVDEGGWFSSARVLPFESVQTVGPDAVLVPSKAAVIDVGSAPEIARVLRRDNVLKGTKIMTTDGRDLGSMRDLYFDERTGAIEGYDVSGGLFADAYEGRSFVPAPRTITIGEDVAFVPPETAVLMEEQVGGIKGAAQSLGGRIEEGAQAAGERLQEGTQMLGEKARSGAEAARAGFGDLAGSASGGLLGAAKGRRVLEPVRGPGGYLIAAPGQIVTDQLIERARAENQEQALLAATGLTAGGAVTSGARGAASSAGSELREGAADLKQGAANLWDRVKGKVGEVKDRSAEELEERRIKAALGRPVTRVILDRQDGVILNFGELITHGAIERARDEGVLDTLLDSVHKGEAKFSQEDLKAPEQGSESLEREPSSGEPPPPASS